MTPREASGGLLARGGPLAAGAVAATALVAAVLVPLHLWRPAVALPALAVAWVLVVAGVLRLCPPSAAGALPGAASVAVALGGAACAAATHAEHVVLRRDAGSYALFAQWLATRHGLPVDGGLGAFGGRTALDVPGFTLASPAYFQVASDGGADVVPQFLLGAPALFSLGWWAGGWAGLLLVPAVLGGLAVLAAAGLTARLAGAAWAPVGALALAVTQPVLHAARSTYSEPAALLLVLGAACLAVDAVRAGRERSGAARGLGAAAGALLGLAGLVRVDSVREVALLLPCCLLLALRRHPAAVPMAGVALLGTAVSAVPALTLSRPYLESVADSLLPLVGATVALALACAAILVVARRRHPQAREAREAQEARVAEGAWPARAVGGAVLAVGLVLATRPWWTTARSSGPDGVGPAHAFVENLQGQQGLALDGSRSYGEQSLLWAVWYVGPAVAVAGWLVLAAVAARATGALRGGGRLPAALLPAAVGLGSTVLTLYRPGITPDHPWADRRLVATVLPTLVLAATAGAAWLTRRARQPWRVAVALAAAAVLVLPAAAATRPLAGARTEVGEPEAVAAVCAALAPGDAVLAVPSLPRGGTDRAANEWPQVVRGVCGRSAAVLATPGQDPRPALDRLAALARGAGSRLVLLAAPDPPTTDPADGPQPAAVAPTGLTVLGLTPRLAVRLLTGEDERLLVSPSRTTNRLSVEVWTAVWPAGP